MDFDETTGEIGLKQTVLYQNITQNHEENNVLPDTIVQQQFQNITKNIENISDQVNKKYSQCDLAAQVRIQKPGAKRKLDNLDCSQTGKSTQGLHKQKIDNFSTAAMPVHENIESIDESECVVKIENDEPGDNQSYGNYIQSYYNYIPVKTEDIDMDGGDVIPLDILHPENLEATAVKFEPDLPAQIMPREGNYEKNMDAIEWTNLVPNFDTGVTGTNCESNNRIIEADYQSAPLKVPASLGQGCPGARFFSGESARSKKVRKIPKALPKRLTSQRMGIENLIPPPATPENETQENVADDDFFVHAEKFICTELSNGVACGKILKTQQMLDCHSFVHARRVCPCGLKYNTPRELRAHQLLQKYKGKGKECEIVNEIEKQKYTNEIIDEVKRKAPFF